ncbi:pimeloyl-ACP methyl ester carboxylesterase [Nocardia sp. GAS34]|uniref:alpha/beta fold hydrolase n=1 Tax=unclassified Nocardia TaxID=2637762 RepID=UPI003D23E1D1
MNEPLLHVTAMGDGQPIVVLEPGLGASSVGWSHVQHQAAATGRARVISYDRAGLGASPADPRPRRLRALAEDLAHVIDSAGGGPAVVVGHSLGATIARQLAAARPCLLAGLVLIDPIPEPWVLRYGTLAAPMAAVWYRTMETLAHAGLIDAVTALPPLAGITRSSTSPEAPLTDAERAQLAHEMRQPLTHETARRELCGLVRSRLELHELSTEPNTGLPLTVLSAGHTHRFAAPLRRAASGWHAHLTSANPRARHLLVPGAGHCLPRYQPETVVAAINDLLDRLHPQDVH